MSAPTEPRLPVEVEECLALLLRLPDASPALHAEVDPLLIRALGLAPASGERLGVAS